MFLTRAYPKLFKHIFVLLVAFNKHDSPIQEDKHNCGGNCNSQTCVVFKIMKTTKSKIHFISQSVRYEKETKLNLERDRKRNI